MKVTVVGAGAGGLALAAASSLAGAEVTVYDRDEAKCAPLQQRGAIELRGEKAGKAPVTASTDAAKAVAGADLILIAVLPRDLAAAVAGLADHLSDNAHLLVSQAHFGAALVARTALAAAAFERQLVVGESASFPFACTSDEPGSVRIIAAKRIAPVAALPGRATQDLVARAAAVIPAFTSAPSVLATSLSDISASVHVPNMLANAGRIEQRAGFDFFAEGLTHAVARLALAYDAERVALATTLGVRVPTVAQWIMDTYGVSVAGGDGLGPALHTVFGASAAPSTITHRYLAEDVACLTVPTLALGAALDIDLPLHRSLVEIASRLCGEDFLRTGRTAAQIGIAGASARALRQLAEGGDL